MWVCGGEFAEAGGGSRLLWCGFVVGRLGSVGRGLRQEMME